MSGCEHEWARTDPDSCQTDIYRATENGLAVPQQSNNIKSVVILDLLDPAAIFICFNSEARY